MAACRFLSSLAYWRLAVSTGSTFETKLAPRIRQARSRLIPLQGSECQQVIGAVFQVRGEGLVHGEPFSAPGGGGELLELLFHVRVESYGKHRGRFSCSAARQV
jgi:hypothetical protein